MTRRCIVLIFVLYLFGPAYAVADPDTLTYADFGIYGRAVSSYYTSEDCPFNLMMLQWKDEEVPDVLAEQIAKAHEMGRKTILYCWFWNTFGEKDGPAPVPTVEDCVERMERFLGSVNHEHIYGITLGEENSPHLGRTELLHEMYLELKKRYPKLRIFQWYTAGLTGWPNFSPVPGFGVPLIGADGWIVDEYYVRGINFKRMMWKYRMLNVPFVCIVWASSGWSPYWEKQSDYDWADSQIDILRRLNLAVGLFSVNQLVGSEGRTLGDVWAWEMDGLGPDAPREVPSGVNVAPNPSTYHFPGKFYGEKGTDKRIYPPTRRKFDKYARWAAKAPTTARPPDHNDREITFMARKMPMTVKLGEEGKDNEGRFEYKDSFEGLVGGPFNGGALLVRHADVSGAMDLYYDGYADNAAFKVRGAKDRQVHVTIIYLLTGEQIFSNLEARIKGTYNEKLGGDLALSVSLDGQRWLSGEKSQNSKINDTWSGQITAGASIHPELKNENYYQAYVRIDMINRSKTDTDFATWLELVDMSVNTPRS